MKAKDYLEEFGQQLIDSEPDFEQFRHAASKIIIRMNDELFEMQKKRHISTNQGAVSMLKELNDKWNALVTLFEKKYGHSPIVRNGYRTYWLKEMPKLQAFWA